jgi:putative transposase
MRQLNIRGVNQSMNVRITRPDSQAGRYPDLVDRQRNADGPNQLWVTNLTFVPT